MANVELANVTKRFGNVVAVNKMSLLVGDEEFLVIVGPTGCGKTTTLKLIAGFERPDEGDIYIGGELVNDTPPERRGVHMVFQNYALWPHMRVFHEEGTSNLGFALKIRNWLRENTKRRVEEIASKIGIERGLLSRMPNQLSEGQKQKVAVGRALVFTPRVLLMDDPLTNLDPQSRLQVRKEIIDVHKELKLTTIFVTHHLPDAMVLADRIAVMREGCFVQIDTPRNVYERPLNEFVRDFIKSFDATISFRSASGR